MRLKDKVAIVTGGGSGFGEGIVRSSSPKARKVLVVDRNLEAARARGRGRSGRAPPRMRADVSRGDDTLAMIDAAEARFGAARHPGQQRRRVAPAAAARGRAARTTSTASSPST